MAPDDVDAILRELREIEGFLGGERAVLVNLTEPSSWIGSPRESSESIPQR